MDNMDNMDNMVDIETGGSESESNVENEDISVDITAEIKVVIVLKENRGSIGVKALDCDPVFDIFEGGLEAALERVPGLVEEARQRWTESPKNPKTERSVPPPQPAPAQPQRAAQRQSTPPSPQQRLI